MATPRTKRKDKRAAQPRADHGANGPAALSRPYIMQDTEQAGIRARRIEDADPISHYRRTGLLTDRQCDALVELTELRRDSGMKASLSAAYGERLGGHGELNDFQAKCWKGYCRLLASAPARTREALIAVAAAEWPKSVGGLLLLREGATALADNLRLNY